MATKSSIPSPRKRHYWVVSPNVKDDENTVGEWRNESKLNRAAFMGYEPDYYDHDQSGPKFAGTIKQGIIGIMPGDVVLIARRKDGEPDIVGFGIVQGNYATKVLDPSPDVVSLRRLSPFKPRSRWPSGIPHKEVLGHTKALAQLHPDKYGAHKKYDSHKKVCDWIEQHLGSKNRKSGEKQRATTERKRRPTVTTSNIGLVDLPESHQLDYKRQTQSKITRVKKLEATLLDGYQDWLKEQDRKLEEAQYRTKHGTLRCDGYEKERRNLIEAKSSARREHIRMAVGQLLDYAFQGKEEFGEPYKAILLPRKPEANIENWLLNLKISIIWRERGSFLDNANGRFS